MHQTQIPLVQNVQRYFKLNHQMAPSPPTNAMLAVAKCLVGQHTGSANITESSPITDAWGCPQFETSSNILRPISRLAVDMKFYIHIHRCLTRIHVSTEYPPNTVGFHFVPVLKTKQMILNCVRGEHKPARPFFCCRDLDLGHMTLKLYRDMNILKTYLHTEKEVARSNRSKVIA